MRKAIFRNELNYIFETNKVKLSDRQKVVAALFENPLIISKQYLLKDEISNLDELDKKIKEIVKEEKTVGSIKTLFIVQEDLECPEEIKKLFLENKKIGILVGAGVSKLIKLPLWKELADTAIKYLYEENLINYFEYQRIMNEVTDPKQKLTIFDSLLPRKNNKSKQFFNDILSIKDPPTENPYEILAKFNAIKLTTNIDKEFYNALTKHLQQLPSVSSEGTEGSTPQQIKKAKIQVKNFTSKYFDSETIYHLHGFIDELEDTILTTKDYVEAYYNNKNGLKTFLNDVFREYSVIFIGYGLEEFPILEHIIRGSRQHYVLIDGYLNELSLLRLKRKYFEILNISPIHYYLDFNGYHRLYTVLNSWIQQIEEARNKEYYQSIKLIDEGVV